MKLMGSEAKVDMPEKGRRQRQLEERERRIEEAKAAADIRAARGRGITFVERVERAQKALDRPLAQARALLDDLSPRDLDVYLLAEELDKNRKGVLQGFPAPGAALRAAYESELAATRPADKE
jgi:hypothetical protein